MNTPIKIWFTVFAIIAFGIRITHAQSLNSTQIKQIEEIAQAIALQSNASSKEALDKSAVPNHTTAVGRNVRFEYVSLTKKGLAPTRIKVIADAVWHQVFPRVCKANANNLAFDRGLYYTFIYLNNYGEKITEFDVDKASCKGFY